MIKIKCPNCNNVVQHVVTTESGEKRLLCSFCLKLLEKSEVEKQVDLINEKFLKGLNDAIGNF